MSLRALGNANAADPRVSSELDALLASGYRYAFSLSHDAAEAEDLLQDACLGILAARASWERGYLFSAIRSRFIDRYRRQRKVPFLSLEGNDEGPAGESASWEAPDVLENGRLERALSQLRVEERETLFLAIVEGYTAEEIGRLTSRPRGSVLSLLHRTKAKLRELLEREARVHP
ncbi:MAG TPA: RNA polymerase sigma factor [Thermoanaerobaculia bacterium]|jgi:RNA polymerase sigma-70 factor (ECF subfamily)|nr:RNA polymerase sigma factor [Thermoanaerobaculia bacterium]